MIELVTRGKNQAVVEAIIMAKMGVQIVEKSQWGKQSASTRPIKKVEAIEFLGGPRIKKSQTSLPYPLSLIREMIMIIRMRIQVMSQHQQ